MSHARVPEANRIPAVDGRCDECGFDYESAGDDQHADALRAFGERYTAALSGVSDRRLRRRPEPTVWSALEYTCHVRDVFRVQHERVEVALVEDRPIFRRSGMWQWPERDGYNAQDSRAVLAELNANAAVLAERVSSLSGEQWRRLLVYAYPEPTERSVLWLVRHTLHEGQHHLYDVARVCAIADFGTN